jgi:hypothetical protein
MDRWSGKHYGACLDEQKKKDGPDHQSDTGRGTTMPMSDASKTVGERAVGKTLSRVHEEILLAEASKMRTSYL